MNNPLHKATRASLLQLPEALLETLGLNIELLLQNLPKTFSIYPPLLLLPAHAFDSPSWSHLLSDLPADWRDKFLAHLAQQLRVAHIALNAPISSSDNVQRRPNITLLYGVFPPFITTNPGSADFDSALWVSTRQNGIAQIWAPQYTMFSRGNITEKARLLSLKSVKSAASTPKGCTVVDLFSGIGYFVFSYAKAGCKKILGFELNPWSVEGLRRGAEANTWKCKVLHEDLLSDLSALQFSDMITVFQTSNVRAAEVVERNRQKLPPVQHINLGLLPTSSGAWEVAVKCLDPILGGWLHVHENFATKEINTKAVEVREKVEQITRTLGMTRQNVELEHVERVKTYAPGVMHCVLDIHIYHTKS